MKTLYLEFVGRPSSGKSTTAHGVFSELKKRGVKTEFVGEYAKELVYRKDFNKLGDQFMVSSEQNFRENLLSGVVDIVVTDTSLLLGNVYNVGYECGVIRDMIQEMRKDKKYLTIFVNNKNGDFSEYGRTQSKEQALTLNEVIKESVKGCGGTLFEVDKDGGVDSVMEILSCNGVL